MLFRNETGRSELDRLAQQLTDAAVVALAQNPAYAIIGNAAILRTPRVFEDLKAIGSTLSADYILVAQVQEPPTGLIVRAHFIRASDQTHLWANGITAPAGQLEQQVVETIVAGRSRSETGAGTTRPAPLSSASAFCCGGKISKGT